MMILCLTSSAQKRRVAKEREALAKRRGKKMQSVHVEFANEAEWSRSQQPQGLPVLYIPRSPRRDGKFAVTYAFTGRNIRAIITAEKLATEQASGKYELRTAR